MGSKKFAIIDVETTGVESSRSRITEVAIIVTDGNTILEEFSSLINPEMSIPYFITQLTGITNSMVSDAPYFYQVAKKIVELTKDCIFVAHNVRFDYGMIKEEFKRIGYDFRSDLLCTVKLARKFLPGHASYSLSNLTDKLLIDHKSKHRALGDAKATFSIFKMMFQENGKYFFDKDQKREARFPPSLDRKVVDDLPEETGVYYLLDEREQIIYVGKSINIKDRILQHILSAKPNSKAERMVQQIHSIRYTLTGNELLALIVEAEEIKKHLPIFNVSGRRTKFFHGISVKRNVQGYDELVVGKLDQDSFIHFTTRMKANHFLETLIEEHQLCQKLCGMYHNDRVCFNYQVKKCLGACAGHEPAESYNKRIDEIFENYRYPHPNFQIIEKGRTKKEKVIIQIKNGVFYGYAFVNYQTEPEFIRPAHNNQDFDRIILSFMRQNSLEIVHESELNRAELI